MGFGVTDIFSTRDELHAGTRPVTITTTRANRNVKRACWPIIGALRKDLNPRGAYSVADHGRRGGPKKGLCHFSKQIAP